jgi:SAM-dependent methyltransferase
MSARYWKADLNFAELPPERYDLIVAQTSLHHVLRLEHLADQLAGALKPDGLLWVRDFIGEAQFQFIPKRRHLANALLGVLPDELTWNEVRERHFTEVPSRPPGGLNSPFESIRSDEIMPILLERFTVIRSHEHDSILRFVCPPGTRAAYNRTPENRRLFEALFELDRALVQTGALPPTGGQYLLRRRSAPEPPVSSRKPRPAVPRAVDESRSSPRRATARSETRA